ncbi:MAG TPA: LPS export ABC transporter periplasmic protein LptC [Rhizomicrobium sp.]|jgi:lipopolysaccharide export system protein LptC|nr:LPS export ABC transporter periplasmic protein LptC [Rhizomicrobium sp.]
MVDRAAALKPKRRDWGARPRATMLDAERYTRFVTLMKRALPIGALVLLAVVAIYVFQPRQQDRVAMTFESVGEVANDLAMIKPRLSGSDSKGNPFVVTADRAIQQGRNSRKARLVNVDADMTLDHGRWLNATAASGLFDADAKSLMLDGGISVYSDNGYELHTKSARFDLKKGFVRGEQTVTGQGPLGTVRADRFEVDKTSQQIRLYGNVHTTILKADKT